MSVSTVVERQHSLVVTDTSDPWGSAHYEASSFPEIFLEKGIISKGGPLPGWKARIRAGLDATTALEAIGYDLSWVLSTYTGRSVQTYGSAVFSSATTGRVYAVSNLLPPGGPMVAWDSADNLAIARFARKVRDAQSSFEGGVFLGELREALRLLKPSQSSLVRGIRDGYLQAVRDRVVRLNKRRSRRSKERDLLQRKDVIAETWLEYSFGLTPLISDVDAARKEIARYANHKASSVLVQAGAQNRLTESAPAGSFSHPAGSISYDVVKLYKTDVKYRGSVAIQTGYGQRSLRQSLGLTWSNFIPTVYELIPYSFLVDYFTNLGDLVSAVSLPESSLRWYYKGTRWENEHRHASGTVLVTPGSANISNSFNGYVGSSRLKRFGVFRFPMSGDPPVPKLRFRVPTFPRQFFNLAALGITHRKVLRSIR